LYARKAGLSYIRNHPQEFGTFSQTTLDQEVGILAAEINNIRNFAFACGRDSRKCQLPRHLDVPAPPDRVVGWQNVDPRIPRPIAFGGVSGEDKKIVEVRGAWYANCPGKAGLQGPKDNNELTFHNRKTGEDIKTSWFGPMLGPPDSDVLFRVLDGPTEPLYADNCPVPGNEIQIRIFAPVYPGEFAYPPQYKPPK
jgi:hypothetical protein